MSKFQVLLDGHTFEIEMNMSPAADADAPVRVNGEIVHVRVPAHQDFTALPEWIVIGDRPYEVVFDTTLKHLYARGKAYALQIRDLETGTARPVSGDGRVKAPIPGIVTQILVNPDDAVTVGQLLLILEAMKMENQIRAPRSGILTSLNVNAGEGVVLGQLLAEIT
jgi:biotin carboxyl carrier protein